MKIGGLFMLNLLTKYHKYHKYHGFSANLGNCSYPVIDKCAGDGGLVGNGGQVGLGEPVSCYEFLFLQLQIACVVFCGETNHQS